MAGTALMEQNRQTEILVAVLEERLVSHNRQMLEGFAGLRIDISELGGSMKALEARERERNGQMKELTEHRNAELSWRNLHEKWSTDQAAILGGLADKAKDDKVRGLVWRQIGGGAIAGAGALATIIGILKALGLS